MRSIRARLPREPETVQTSPQIVDAARKLRRRLRRRSHQRGGFRPVFGAVELQHARGDGSTQRTQRIEACGLDAAEKRCRQVQVSGLDRTA